MARKDGDSSRRRRHFIREWREFRGLTQIELADMLNMTSASISRIESLKQGYTQNFLEACADALGTHPGVLLMRAPTAADAFLPDPAASPPSLPVRHGRVK
uniref:Helix-turn-helix domain protein n=1 Tax=Rhodopseudomonas palustris (strain DX-1) TaxID=652103 RepID=E6VFJ9_RHOPX